MVNSATKTPLPKLVDELDEIRSKINALCEDASRIIEKQGGRSQILFYGRDGVITEEIPPIGKHLVFATILDGH